VARNRRTDHGQHAALDPKPAPATARSLAAIVLERVTDDGAYASRALDAELSRAQLQPRDAALATEILYGSLRVLPALDRALEARLTRAPARMDGFVRATLRTAAYQLAHLGRLPTHAIVDESVTQVRALRGPKLAGFVNAILRRMAEARPEHPEPAEALILPQWVKESLLRALGPERLARFLEHSGGAAGLCLRADRSSRDELLLQLRAALPGADIEPTQLSPLGVLVRRVGSPRGLPGFREGAFSVQEEGAQLIALALAAQPDERIADVCAGHGGKTMLLARQIGAGSLCAIDKDERKLRDIPRELKRIGFAEIGFEFHAIDLSVGTGGLTADFDRVLVDAPCTGLGTTHRRPELLLRLKPEDPARMGALQCQILGSAAGLVRPGGLLAYAVCSSTREEGHDVARAFEREHPEFTCLLEPLNGTLPAPDPDGVLHIGPWLAQPGPDAYQLVLWRRKD
jgi:16S rRNA (cytosine967-C5)-methyltransferase